jgi:hypothetical protein
MTASHHSSGQAKSMSGATVAAARLQLRPCTLLAAEMELSCNTLRRVLVGPL